ncbi:MAG: metal-dependent hydrolase [Thermodesulfovibrionales bacterium]|nr:metal-dependent hydrolase [Thermodesulfovibrionales bacterium]
MDPITHTFTGLAVKQIGFNRKASIAIVIIASLLPDIDYITRIWGADVLLRYHRGITHGIGALFVFPLLLAFLFKNRCGFWYSYILSFLAFGLHLLFDLTNSYGTRILSPLDFNAYSLDIMFIIEPWLTIPLLISFVAGLINKKRASIIAISAIILVSMVFASRYYLQTEAKRFLKSNIDANIYMVLPIPNDFLTWGYLTQTKEYSELGIVDLFTRRVLVAQRYENKKDPLIDASKENKIVKNFLYFAKTPHAEVVKTDDGSMVIWRELRYALITGERFSVKVKFDKNGNIKQAGFRI